MCPAFTDDDVGKTVVNASGEEVGMVTAVEHRTARVEPDPGITDTIKATLGWEGTSDDTYPLQEESVERVTDDEIRLSGELHEGPTESSRTESLDSSDASGDRETINSGRSKTATDPTTTDEPRQPNPEMESTDDRRTRDAESSVPNRDVEGRRDERGGRGHPDDRPMDPERGDERGQESGLMDTDHDARTDRTRGSRGRDEGDEARDPDVGDGEYLDEGDPKAGISDRDRHGENHDTDEDSDRS